MAALREPERVQLVVLLHAQIREHSTRGSQQVESGRCFSLGMKIPMARHRRVAQPEIIGSDINETATGEDRIRWWAVEALSELAELTGDVRIRYRVVKRYRSAVQIHHGR